MKSNWLVVAGTVVTALLPGRVEAHSGVIRFAASGAGNFTLEGDLGPGAPPIINIPLPAPMSATAKRDYVVQYVASVPGIQMVPLESDRCICRFLIPHATIRVRNGDTASINTAIAARASAGKIGFTGLFDPFDANHQPAVFTAGIVTDVGELSVNVTAAELNFQTDGPIICQALFQRLAPRAPQYGAQINYAGDRLEVYFDPAYTVTQGGIIFGTTSPSPGAFGTIDPLPLGTPGSGDGNGDGKLNGLDVRPCVLRSANAPLFKSTFPLVDPHDMDLTGDGLFDPSDGAALAWKLTHATCP
ncbi:MAG: hypothetical protein U1A27_14015 [Phycisphaerae bacterium]